MRSLKETTFLVNEVRALAKQIDDVSTSEKKLKKNERREALVRTFFIMWFGFAAIPAMFADSFLDKQFSHQYNQWILGGTILFGFAYPLQVEKGSWK